MADRPKVRGIRCAIYTRKSSEEGLEQDFNSLDAQREACEAYVRSQKHEGWKAVSTPYDDGGFSGGSLERPALTKLLTDIRAGTIDVVVVYKVDRLTRSLADFAKIVETFDQHGVSFVSVTQQFNTTSSMGRLTLNILLSFAQFEREVTGERIRDKFAASKKKGLWMGGYVPLGYRPNGRTLVIHKAEARIIRMIFGLYRESASVAAVEAELQRRKICRPPSTTMTTGRTYGSRAFGRGEIYKLLANPVYAGDIGHKGQRYQGQHPAIIDRETWTAVRTQLAANTHARYVRFDAKDPSLLAGLLYDEHGNRLTPTHASKQGRRYRYYGVQSAPMAGRGPGRPKDSERRVRVAAAEIETVVIEALRKALLDPQWLLDACALPQSALAHQKAIITKGQELAERLRRASAGERRELLLVSIARVTLAETEVRITLRREGLMARLGPAEALSLAGAGPKTESARGEWWRQGGRATKVNGHASLREDDLTIVAPVTLRRRGAETKLIIDGPDGPNTQQQPDVTLIKVIAQAHRWKDDILAGRFPTLRALARAYDKDERYVARLLPLAFLAPHIVKAALVGEHPVGLTAQDLVMLDDIPPEWSVQAETFGFTPARAPR